MRPIGFLTLFFIILSSAPPVWAKSTPHPMTLYEQVEGIWDEQDALSQDLQRAEDQLLQLVEKFPYSPLGHLGLSRVFIKKAQLVPGEYNMKWIYDQALPHALLALEYGPTLRAVHENYHHIEKIQEQHFLARKEAEVQLALAPEEPQTFLLIGIIYGQQSEWEKALDYYQLALDLNPAPDNEFRILKRMAWICLYQQEDFLRVVEYGLRALDIQADDLMHEYLGAAYLKLGNFREAEGHLRAIPQARLSKESRFRLLFARAALAEQEGRTIQAIHLFVQAADLDHQDSEVLFKLGNLYFRLGNFHEAYHHFQKVIKLSPQEASAHYFAGRAAYSLGKPDVALSHLAQYLLLGTDDDKAAWIRRNVPELSQK